MAPTSALPAFACANDSVQEDVFNGLALSGFDLSAIAVFMPLVGCPLPTAIPGWDEQIHPALLAGGCRGACRLA